MIKCKKGCEQFSKIIIVKLFIFILLLGLFIGVSIEFAIADPNQEDNSIVHKIDLNKPFYTASDMVEIKIISVSITGEEIIANLSELELYIEPNIKESIAYKYLGLDENMILFSASNPGEYTVRLFLDGVMLDEKQFIVYGVYDACKELEVNMENSLDLTIYNQLESNEGALVLPESLELLFDDSYGIKKYVLSPISDSSVLWTPINEGKYSLYADGEYLDCFKVSRINTSKEFLDNSLVDLDNSLVKSDVDSQNNLLLSNANKSYSKIMSNFNFTKDHSRIKILDSKRESLEIDVKFYKPKIKKSENIKNIIPKNVISSDIENALLNINNISLNASDISNSSNVLNVSGVSNLSDVLNVSDISNNNSLIISDNQISDNQTYVVNQEQGFVADAYISGQQIPQSDIIENDSFDVEINFRNSPIGRLNIEKLKYKDNMEIGVDELNKSKEYIVGRTAQKAYAVNLYDLQFNVSSFTAIASATELWKCKDWNFTTQECYGTWEFYMNLTPGSEYSVKLYPGDPGFVEAFDSNLSVDVDLVAINNDTIVMSWVSAATGFPLKFKIMYTNGSIIVNDTTIDATGDATSRVSLAAIDQNNFIIGSFDGPAQAQYFYIYDISGVAIQGQTSVDPVVGTQSDVDVCQLGDRFPFIYANDDAVDQDADFKIFNNSGAQITGETNVDGAMTPELSNQNLVSCSAFNSTAWAYVWYDAAASDDMTIAARSDSGVSIVAGTDIDGAVGNNPQVASTGLRNQRVAVVFYDSADDDITITIRQLNGAAFTTTLANTDIDLNAGIDSRVAIQEIDMTSQSYFVVAWQDTLDATIKAGIYNETGAQIVAPFNITKTPSATYMILDLAGYSSNINFGLCNGAWAIAYSNSSGNAVWETYDYSGARWDGVCPDVNAPIINLTYPENDSTVELSSYELNYTAVDDRDVILNNCSLFANFSGSFIINRTFYNVSAGINYFNVSGLPDAQYLWNVRCFDNSSNSAFAPNNFTYRQNYYIPSIINAAINRTEINQSETVKFNATITDSWGVDFSYVTLFYPNGSDENITLQRNGVEHYTLFSDTIQSGEYSFTYIRANDSLGQSNNLTLSLKFNVTTSDPEIFNLLTPEDLTVSKILIPNLSWEESYDYSFANYTILIDKDLSFSTPDFVYHTYALVNNSYVVDYALDANTVYYWMVIAYDIFGNSRNSTDIFSYITDTLAPYIELNSPQNNSYVSGLAMFNYTPTDTNTIDSCVLYGNWTGSFVANETNNSINNSNPNYFEKNIQDGMYIWNMICYDIANNSGFSSSNNTFIVDNIGPYVNLMSPQNNTFENTTNNMVFFANATDILSNISNCSLIINQLTVRFKSPVAEAEEFNMTYFLDNGQHNWSMSCYDTNGNIGNSNIYNLTLNVTDNDPPFIIRNYPDDGLHIAINLVLFNYSVDDSAGIENCSIYINDIINSTNNTVNNHDFNYFDISGFIEDTYNYSIECYDNTTQKNYARTTTRTFYVDLTSPTITLVYPTLNSQLTESLINFEYIPIDDYLLSCRLYGDFDGAFEEQQVNNTPQSGVSNFFIENLADGAYIWNVLCEDEALRSAFALQNYSFIIDTTPPYYDNVTSYPQSPATFTPQKYYFNITLGDNINFSTAVIEHNFLGLIANYTVIDYVVFGSDRIYYYIIENLSSGSYNYRWYANDSAGNINSTPIFYYTIEASNSSIYALLDGIHENKSIDEDNYVNLSLDLLMPSQGYVELFLQGLLINNGTFGVDQIYNYTYFVDPGFYNLTSIYYATQNYSYAFDSVFLTVNDTTDPSITLMSPGNNSNVTAGEINLQYIVNDKSNITNCSLFVNGSFIDNSSYVQTNMTQGFTASLGIGNYSWYIECHDLFDNNNISEIRYFSAFNASIVLVNVATVNASYQSGETAVININTTGFFGDSMNTNFTADIILGNTTIPWWNASYENRKQLSLSNAYSIPVTTSIEVNITGLNGLIDNCTKLRIAYFDGINNQDIAHELISGDNNDSCNVWFTATVPALSSSNYYVYYDNSSSSYSGTVQLSGIKIQRGSVAGTGVSLTANVETANRSKSFVLFTVNAASSSPTIIHFIPTMSIDTQIGFDRYGSGTNANISWQLVEGSDITVQRGSGALLAAAASINFTIDEVNLSNSFIIADGRVNTATAGNNIRGYFTGRFVNSTYISLDRATTGTAATASYQVVEWKNTNVQSGNISFTSASVNIDISQINLSRSLIVISKAINGDTGMDASLVKTSFVNSTGISIGRFTGSGTANVSWFVIELPVGYEVQSGDLSVSSSDVDQNVSNVAEFKAFHIATWTNTGGGTTYANSLMTSLLTNSTNIFFDKQTTSQTNSVSWFVIEEKQPTYAVGSNEILIDRMVNTTAPLGSYTWTWSTYNQSLSLYSVVVLADKPGYQSGLDSEDFNITPDITLPNVILVAPEDQFITGQGYFNFSYIPYDLNLKNCTLYYGKPLMQPNITNATPMNNATNNFTNINLGVGLYYWNVLCYDTFNNSAYAQYNYTLNITSPDLYVDSSRITFSDGSVVEGSNITIFANISNEGLSPNGQLFIVQFFRNDPSSGGEQINGNLTIAILNPGEYQVLNVSYIVGFGLNNIFVRIDPDEVINETTKVNNKANNSLSVELYQYFYGNISADILLATSANYSIKAFKNLTSNYGNLFISDYDSSFSFTNLQALGRNIVGDSTNNDFSELDSALNSSGLVDSIKNVWAAGGDIPTFVRNVSLSSLIIENVPFNESTNNSNFYTGILWDTADDALNNFQFDDQDREDIVFVTEVGIGKQGSYGFYTYEIRVPAVIRNYKTGSDSVAFYFELI